MKFEDAIEYVLQWEGGYSNDPNDRGGETAWGISKRSHPDVDIKSLTREQAIEIYRKEYWEKYQFETIPDYFRGYLFDMAINMGFKNAVICLQRSLNIGLTDGYHLKEDGVLGEKTKSALTEFSKEWLYTFAMIYSLKSERAAYYRVLAAKDPSQEKFLSGWLRRSYF